MKLENIRPGGGDQSGGCGEFDVEVVRSWVWKL